MGSLSKGSAGSNLGLGLRKSVARAFPGNSSGLENSTFCPHFSSFTISPLPATAMTKRLSGRNRLRVEDKVGFCGRPESLQWYWKDRQPSPGALSPLLSSEIKRHGRHQIGGGGGVGAA